MFIILDTKKQSVDAFRSNWALVNALLNESTMDTYFKFNDKYEVNQALQYTRKKPLIDWQIRNCDDKQIWTWMQIMGWGSATQMTEWTIK